ncbi:DUF1297 domain-containing protein [Candidatus Microgenomates bacterium]|nr:MAG: DUF1297 domain-containing protein [Candidatus Microgenomates bacterium]
MHLPTIAVLGSHSALDVCRGAKDEGFSTLVISEKGREQTYKQYYKVRSLQGCIDECLVLDKFSDILLKKTQLYLQKKNCIFVPHRSFEVYLNFDYASIEKKFLVPIFGNKYLLKIEERHNKVNQYDLLKLAKIRYPQQFADPQKINRLCLVKVLEKARGFERAFFLVRNFTDYEIKSKIMIKQGKITQKALSQAVIEEFVLGTPVNFNFFYSPLTKRIELLGTDTRRQTNLDGILRLPGDYQQQALQYIPLSFEESGHIAVTVLESLLESAFIMAERFVKASQKLIPPGIIGPFSLQSIITSGPPKKEIVVIDVSPRMPGSPGTSATPYTYYLYGNSLSVGRRVAQEIKQAIDSGTIQKITT